MTQHPTTDTLLAYLEAPEQASFGDLRLHIAACRNCRGTLAKLQQVQNLIQQTGVRQARFDKPSAQLCAALESQSIERYLDGELPDPQAAQIKSLLQTDASALKAALHYAGHSANQSASYSRPDMVQPQADTMRTSSVSHRSGKTSTWLDSLKQFLDFKSPLWVSVPATAAIVFMLATAILPTRQTSPAEGVAVATYQDKAVIHFQGAGQLPGIGFFSKAHSSTQNFGPMKIHFDSRHTLALQWPQVANATIYHLTVYLITNGQKITIKEMDVNSPQALLTDFKPAADKRYEWTLNGETKDAKTFYTSGGFVINNLQKR